MTSWWTTDWVFHFHVGLMSMSSSPAGLQILYTLLQNVSNEEAAAQSFYQTYFCDILQHIFSVVTDTSHTAGEAQQLYRPSFIKHSCIKVNSKFWFNPLPACLPALCLQVWPCTPPSWPTCLTWWRRGRSALLWALPVQPTTRHTSRSTSPTCWRRPSPICKSK